MSSVEHYPSKRWKHAFPEDPIAIRRDPLVLMLGALDPLHLESGLEIVFPFNEAVGKGRGDDAEGMHGRK